MAKKTNPYLYEHEAKGKTRYGYRREYKGTQLRARGFVTLGEAEQHLNQAVSDIEAKLRGEVRCKPTTAQEALDIYRRNLEVRAKDKSSQFAHNVRSNCKVLQEFVDEFGPTRLIRECTETDLREFYQRLCFRTTLSRNSAAVFVGRVQGMLKAAQATKPDLINWLRPKLKVNRKTEFERRVVEDWEYKHLVEFLLNPPCGHKFNSRKEMRAALWRDAADAVVLLRLTGGRLNEVLRMKLSQFNWQKGTVRLYATKTENERDVPFSKGIERVVRTRIKEGLTKSESLSTDASPTGDGFVFQRAITETFDNAIARACLKAARLAKLNYGQAHGWTCHSLRHTFITHLMKATHNDVGTVMKYSGHKTLESFSNYIHATDEGRLVSMQALDNVDGILTVDSSVESVRSVESVEVKPVKLLKRKQV
jgi:integrase